MMRILDNFSAIPTCTAFLVIVYAAIFSAVFVTDELQDLPASGSRLRVDLDEAYADLHKIAARPHPYNSHANDAVRSYILSRLHDLTSGHPHIQIVDDLVSNASWAIGSVFGVYFEGTNILVKIDGSDEEYQDRGGVLFSAHYDSVATAPGATDDGMGVAVLLHMVKYLAENRPRRTTVFNINNGEEDGLHGAHAFLEHPWSNLTTIFLNLEGAAAGGRPILFRATSTTALRSFQNENVPHPHANVISADAFARGIIRSETDYVVYTKGLGRSMDGLDFAFYRGRSKYHTKYDSIPGMAGGKNALWAMMESVRGAGDTLVNSVDQDNGPNDEKAVYFDLFGATLIVFSLRAFITTNMLLATLGSSVVIFLVAMQSLIVYNRRLRENGGSIHGHGQVTFWRMSWEWFTHLGWMGPLWRWVKFWLALVIGIALQVLLAFVYIHLNPLIIYSQPYLVFTSLLALAYLSTVLMLKVPISRPVSQLLEQQENTVMLQMYIFTWILLVLSILMEERLGIGGLYFVSAWNFGAFLGCVLGCIRVISEVNGTEGEVEGGGEGEGGRLVRFDLPTATEEGEGPITAVTEPTEATPLLRHHRAHRQLSLRNRSGKQAAVWWILQAVVAVPLPVILMIHIAVLLLAALPQTLSDGSSPVIVYGLVVIVSMFVILPIAPFTFRCHRYLTYFMVIMFFTTTAYNFLAFPFSQDAPFKIHFRQNMSLSELESITKHMDNTTTTTYRPVTTLAGVKGYVDKVTRNIPSSWTNDVGCAPVAGMNLWSCSWESDLLPDPNRGDADLDVPSTSEWLQVVNTTRLGANSARLTIKGANTRYCKVYFDNKAISSYRVAGDNDGKIQQGYEVPVSGLKGLRLWSRTWDRTFVVDVQWEGDEGMDTVDQGLKGRVGCGWSEYESGSVGIEEQSGKIPALEEVFTFLPKWAVVASAEVEVWVGFEV